jgi:hypothetical protein
MPCACRPSEDPQTAGLGACTPPQLDDANQHLRHADIVYRAAHELPESPTGPACVHHAACSMRSWPTQMSSRRRLNYPV